LRGVAFRFFRKSRNVSVSCSPNSPHLISQLGVTDGTLAVYQVRACSKIVSVHRVNVPIPECRIASSSWTPEGNLFVSGEFGDVWLMVMDANQLYSVVKSGKHEPPRSRPIVVAYKSGVVLVDANEIAVCVDVINALGLFLDRIQRLC
jgi:hypothetical protein